MKTILSIFCIIFMLFASLWAQSIEIKEKEDKPLTDIGDTTGQTRGILRRKAVKPDKYTIRYIQISPGPNGSIQGLSTESVMDQRLIEEFNFPSLYFLVSVAARLIPESSYKNVERIGNSLKILTELRQLCLNVKISALDANKYVISQPIRATRSSLNANNYFVNEFGKEPVLTLGIAPYETMYAQTMSQESKISDGIGTAAATANIASSFLNPDGSLGKLASFFNPLGVLASGISAIFAIFSPTKNAPNQIAYQSAPNEFGWIWRQQEGYGVEGIHNCMALLRTHKSVKYILAEVELITDWKRFGAWLKRIDYIIPVVSNE